MTSNAARDGRDGEVASEFADILKGTQTGSSLESQLHVARISGPWTSRVGSSLNTSWELPDRTAVGRPSLEKSIHTSPKEHSPFGITCSDTAPAASFRLNLARLAVLEVEVPFRHLAELVRIFSL